MGFELRHRETSHVIKTVVSKPGSRNNLFMNCNQLHKKICLVTESCIAHKNKTRSCACFVLPSLIKDISVSMHL